MTPPTLARRCLIILTACLALGPAACSSPPKAKADTDYTAMFNSGRYADAYEASSRAAGSLRGGNHDMAALIAGQSAYRLGRPREAEQWLKPLLDSSTTGVAGRASATLGSLARDRGENRQAFELFRTASTKLTGDDAARALMYAGDAKNSLGEKAEANQYWSQARDRVEADVQLRVQIGDRLAGMTPTPGTATSASGGQFTVQAGAFASRPTADALAAKLAAHGPTRVVPLSKNGKMLYAVRVGTYRTKAEADRVRLSVGKGAVVTQMTGE